ncbi:RNA-guided endonuclease TnpB family protein [Sporosarcina sp. FA9]|uniref:RNA-guided endonuclease TnpB family protein n=1 Tax=Sporosarcina sp. FA9 TaxID=3413030 RepID=UPI003F65C58E
MVRRKTVVERNKELEKEGKKLLFYGMKIRAITTPAQYQLIVKSIGCARFAYNAYLAEKQKTYKETKKAISYSAFKKDFVVLKKNPAYEWLSEPDKFALECAMEQVDDAYDRFFKGQTGYPKFKSKHTSKQSYSTKETNGNLVIDFEKQRIKIPKLGWINVRFSKGQIASFQESGFNGKVKAATLTVHGSQQTHISLRIEEVVSLREETDWTTIPNEKIIGCDLGLTHFLIDSNGNKIENPRHLKNSLGRLAMLQRRLKNKIKGSSNYKKQQQQIAKLHLRITNTRKDFLHKESRKLVNENQIIVLEDLNVKSMIKNRRLARSISDVGWSTFVTFVKYKADWDHKKIVLIGRFFASSKKCNGCEEKNTLLSLSDRTWVCSKCGREHDRDLNAAKNIKEEGIRILAET